MIYLVIKELYDAKLASISELYEIAGIPRSSYYKWLNRKESSNEAFNKACLL